MTNKQNEIIWKIKEYKDLLKAIHLIKTTFEEIDSDTYFRPYELIKNDIERLEYKLYKEYEKVYKKIEKIKKNLTIDDILSIEYE